MPLKPLSSDLMVGGLSTIAAELLGVSTTSGAVTDTTGTTSLFLSPNSGVTSGIWGVNTAALADTFLVSFSSSNSALASRGGLIQLGGANHASRAGNVDIYTGSANAASSLTLHGMNATSLINFTTGGDLTRWSMLANGDLESNVTNGGNVVFNTLGKGFTFRNGANTRAGGVFLVAGTATVANTSVGANTQIIVSRSVTGGTVGHLSTTKVNGVSFTINSTSATDTSAVNYILFETF